MLRRLLTTSLTVLLLHTQMPLALAMQNPEKEAKASAKMKEKAMKLGVGAKIKVKLRGNTELNGTLTKVEESNLVVTGATGKEASAAYKDIVSVGKPGLSKGSKIALGIVVGFGAVMGVFFAVCRSSACSG
jgi:small nuclear ribonucleoprotein (snRNP)-like protein